jgi:hypothetical protein
VSSTLMFQAIFLYIGAVMPWNHFGDWYGITPWRLVVLGILVMLVRRLPWVMVLVRLAAPMIPFQSDMSQSRWIPTLPTWREAVFAGFFGPIGGSHFWVWDRKPILTPQVSGPSSIPKWLFKCCLTMALARHFVT